MLHTAGVSMPEISVPSSGRNKPPPRILGGSLLIACSRLSDSGVRREGREREKNKEEKRERGGTLTPTPPPRLFFFFFFFFSHLFVVSPRSERLEQTTLLIPETLFFELSAANSIPAFVFLRYSSILFGIAPKALIIFVTTFTLSIFHNSHSRSKNVNSVSLCGFSFTVISSQCDTRITLTAQAKGIGAAGNENYIFFLFYH